MSQPYRLAVLLCDTPLPSVQPQHGATYHPIFDALLKASVPEGITYELAPYDVVTEMAYPTEQEIEEIDGVLLTGSAASAYENLEWINCLVDWTRRLINERPEVKVFGICFGHQIIGRAVGGECVPNDGKWEVGTTTVDLSPVGQKLFGTTKLNIQQMHRDHVPSVPKPFHLLGSTSVAHNQGMVLFDSAPFSSSTSSTHSTYSSSDDSLQLDLHSIAPSSIHVLTLQGHPEFTTSISDLIVQARAGTGVLSGEIAEDAYRRNKELRNDGIEVVGRLIWEALKGRRKENGSVVV